MESNENEKLYYKMYKSGKFWVFTGVLSTVIALGLISNNKLVKADTTQNSVINDQNGDANSINQLSNNDSSASLQPNTLKLVNGNYVYINSDGSTAKSTLINLSGNNYYFDQDGNLTDFSKITPTSTAINSINDKNNAIYANNNKYITNVNGFLTANSWYRPKKILQNGNKWINSNSKDFRPLLSVWWPNVNVQVNYVNYMNKLGLSNVSLNTNSSQAALDEAVKEIRTNIERKIYANHGSLVWLHKDISKFIKSQSEWNLNSENYNLSGDGGDSVNGFQGGTLIYSNNKLTPYANSKYRLLNRVPSKQTGKNIYPSHYIGNEMLLANDVDNSNPTVQAEDLNWLYYLMHFGSLIQNNDKANFDGIRVDAVDNMDADVLNIANNYFELAYHTNRSEKDALNHLAILEDWSKNDPQYLRKHNSNQITIDAKFKDQLSQSLFMNPNDRSSMESLINGLISRKADYSKNNLYPNYSMVRAHDSGVQDVLANIITDNINSQSNGFILSNNELKRAFTIYNNDQKQTNKKYTQYNIPSSYALMLTNKDTVPRVYYGDLFTDDGQFMAHKSIYYTPINAMLNARIKYVAGGQSMNVVKVGNESTASSSNSDSSSIDDNSEVLTSVRYGKGALTPQDKGNNTTRKSGIAVVESNNPNLKLSSQDKVVINMGAAHKNQAYRPLVDSSENGLVNYDNDNDTKKVIYTDSEGNLTLTSSDISGYSNPQESGYLSMWVPVGASANQDIRTKPSNKKNKNGRIINSDAALDSNLIFESFSNFQSQPTKKSQYENVIIPKKTNLFKSWGVTYMQLPPQYRSVGGNSFLDATVRNGYAFNDRYDLGFNKPTKYGTVKQLADTIKSLHRNGIKVMADFVPDQLYSMPKQQVVEASKSTIYGNPIQGSNIYKSLYASNTQGSGNDYQAKYGGKFLKKLKKLYPSLFKVKQISTNKPIDASSVIKVWSAKYFNGTNTQGKGAYYILSNINNSGYFTVKNNQNKGIKNNYLPKQLYGKNFTYGLQKKGNSVKYITNSGYYAKNGFYQDPNGNWYYFDKNGNMVTTNSRINNSDYYFLPNGINLRNFIQKGSDGKYYYYAKTGPKEKTPGYYSVDGANYFYVQKDGSLMTGLHTMDSMGDIKQFFNDEGTQVKGQIINVNGVKMYLDPNSGNVVMNKNVTVNGVSYYADASGSLKEVSN